MGLSGPGRSHYIFCVLPEPREFKASGRPGPRLLRHPHHLPALGDPPRGLGHELPPGSTVCALVSVRFLVFPEFTGDTGC